MLSEEEIERNVQGIKRILEQLIASGNGAGPAPLILNNLVSQQRRRTQACDCCLQSIRICLKHTSDAPLMQQACTLCPGVCCNAQGSLFHLMRSHHTSYASKRRQIIRRPCCCIGEQ